MRTPTTTLHPRLDGVGLRNLEKDAMGHSVRAVGSIARSARRSTANPADTREAPPRSGYGSVPGAEIPTFVYVSVILAFGWVMLASWVAFARDGDAALALAMASVLGIVFFALPVIVHLIAVAHSRPEQEPAHEFLSAPVETATGSLPAASAWLQVLLIPLTLALAATLIGATYVLVAHG
jgi:hypothetical protein